MDIVDLFGKLRDSKDVQFVDEVFKLKSLGKHWEAIDLIVKNWTLKNPKKYRSFLIEVDTKRKTRNNQFGSNKSKSLRSLLDIPEDIIYRIRKVYNPSELSFDKEFYNYLYRKYPQMRASEKL